MSDDNQGPLEERRAERRAQILRAASSVFLDAGFERTSVDRIAAVAHMSKQSIYEQFPSKMALFEAAVRCELDGGRSQLATVVPTDNPEETLHQFGQRLFDGFADPANFGLFRANIVAANQLPDLADDLHEHRMALSRKLANYLETLAKDGFLDNADPLFAAVRFGGLAVEGSRYFLGQTLPPPADRETIINSAVDLFLNGYAGHVDPHGPGSDAILRTASPPVIDSGVALRLSADKLQRLIDAAQAEFLDHGYPSANIDRITAAAQASKATVYRQFGNKEGLFRHVIEREIFTSSQAEFPASPSKDVDEATIFLARQVLDWHLAPKNIRMHRLLVQESDLVSDLARRFHDMRVAVVGRALDRLLAARHLPRPNATAARAFYLLATFAMRFLTARHAPDPAQRDYYSRETTWLFLHGLNPRTA